jgi:Ca2+-binding EF-hand superfamily protein
MGVIVFMLLSGKMPFHGNAKQQAKDITQGKFDLKSKNWEHISALGQNFVRSLLEVNPAKRLDSRAALAHRWIVETCRDSTKVDASVFNAIHSWVTASKFQRMCLSMIAWVLPTTHCNVAQEAFLALDADHDGEISITELWDLATSGKCHVPQEIMQQIHRAHDGQSIQYSELLGAMAMSGQIRLDNDMMHATFAKFDVDGSGFITSANLKALVGDFFEGTKMEALVAEADDNKDGKIDFEEFLTHALWTPPLSRKLDIATSKDKCIDIDFPRLLGHTSDMPSVEKLVNKEATPLEPASRRVDACILHHQAAPIVHVRERNKKIAGSSPEDRTNPHHAACMPSCAVQ